MLAINELTEKVLQQTIALKTEMANEGLIIQNNELNASNQELVAKVAELEDEVENLNQQNEALNSKLAEEVEKNDGLTKQVCVLRKTIGYDLG